MLEPHLSGSGIRIYRFCEQSDTAAFDNENNIRDIVEEKAAYH
jgi:hypothetical protein